MQTRRRIAIAIAVLAGLALALPGCNKIKEGLGSRSVDTFEDGTAEGVVYKALEAAQMDSENDGWKAFKALLHSQQKSPGSLHSWRSNNYGAFRRKVAHYTEDDSKPGYAIDRSESPMDDEVKLFLVNEMSDMPTPCLLKKDPKAKGAWRIQTCSL